MTQSSHKKILREIESLKKKDKTNEGGKRDGKRKCRMMKQKKKKEKENAAQL